MPFQLLELARASRKAALSFACLGWFFGERSWNGT